MIFLSYLIGLTSLGLAFHHQLFWMTIPFFVIVVYHSYRHRYVTTTLYIVSSIAYLGHLSLQSLPSLQPPDVIVIMEKRPTYMIAMGGIKRYYIRVVEQDSFEFGDILKGDFSTRPLSITSYESTFNFKSYLHTKGVYEELIIKNYLFVFQSPLQITKKQDRFLAFFPETNQPWVSQLLFHHAEGFDTQGYYLVYVSGFGFYVMFNMLRTILGKGKIKSKVLPFAMLFPYVLMHLYRISIVRVYLFSMIDDCFSSKEHKKTFKLAILTGLGIFLPHIFLQSGVQLYLLFQLYFLGFQNIISKRPFYLRPMMTLIMVSVIQLIYFKSLSPLSLIFYLPISFLNAALGFILYLPFLIELYTPIFSLFVYGYQRIIDVFLVFSINIYLPALAIPGVIMIFLFALLAIVFYVYRFQKGLKILFIHFLILSSLHLSGLSQFFESPSIHFLNVGQGDSTLIRHRNTNVLIDTGGQLSFDVATDVLIPYFRKLNIRSLNAVILTHGDFDHDGALPSLIKHFKVHRVLRDPFAEMNLGQIKLFQWNKTFTSDDENEKSLVITTQIGTCSVLLMGDASVAIEESILSDLPLSQYDILRTGHHGSLTSTSELFLDRVQPMTAIISVAESNRYGHPHPTVIKRLEDRNIQIRRTDKDGTIVYKSCKL